MSRSGFYKTHSDGLTTFTPTSGYQKRETPPDDDTDSVLTFNDPWEDISALEFHYPEIANGICFFWENMDTPCFSGLLVHHLTSYSKQDRIKDEPDLAEEIDFLINMAERLK